MWQTKWPSSFKALGRRTECKLYKGFGDNNVMIARSRAKRLQKAVVVCSKSSAPQMDMDMSNDAENYLKGKMYIQEKQ